MNLSYDFWVHYYEGLKDCSEVSAENIKGHNRSLIERTWTPGPERIPMQDQALCVKVTYPGVLVGTGYAHAADHVNSEAPNIGLGINLDHVTGLPFIPGSMVKGILRMPFRTTPEYVKEYLQEITGKTWEKAEILELEIRIFGGRNPSWKNAVGNPREAWQALDGQDCFLDAFPVKVGKDLLGLENITPHRSNENPAYDGLINPTPLTLLKVMPGVVFQLRFRLQDTKVGSGKTLTAENKLALFQQILLDMGMGAKTNVGFGALVAAEPVKDACYLVSSEPPAISRNHGSQQQNRQGNNRQNRPGGNQHNGQNRQSGNRQNSQNRPGGNPQNSQNRQDRQPVNQQPRQTVQRANSDGASPDSKEKVRCKNKKCNLIVYHYFSDMREREAWKTGICPGCGAKLFE